MTEIQPNDLVGHARSGSYVLSVFNNLTVDGDFGPVSAQLTYVSKDNNPNVLNLTKVSVDDANIEGIQNYSAVFGHYNVSAVAGFLDNRFALAVQGAKASERGLLVLEKTGNVPAVLNDYAFVPLVNFALNSDNHLAINNWFSAEGNTGDAYALLGTNDGSGQVALINLDRDANPQERVNYKIPPLFQGASSRNISAIIPHPGFSRFYAINDRGEIQTVFLHQDGEQVLLSEVQKPFPEIGAPTRIVASLDGSRRNLVLAPEGLGQYFSIGIGN